MCGISGIVRFDRPILSSDIKVMNESIVHRGNDDCGVYIDRGNSYNIGLGHVRLSILDLSYRGHQPMGISAKGEIINREIELNRADYIIVYNGEIYNYLELREKHDLICEGNSDTEVILRLYRKLGLRCVEEFNGMWAFVIWDRVNDILFCCRDRVGQKPLYYYWDGEEFIFSSELKGICGVKRDLRDIVNINQKGIEFYFSMGFIPSPYSIYNNVYKLEPREYLVLDLIHRKIKKEFYWDINHYDPLYNKKELIEEGRELISEAVKLRLRSDVPIGAFLSGGLDSSTIVAYMSRYIDLKNLHTFSIGFTGKYDETEYMNIVKNYFKTVHCHRYFNESDLSTIDYSYVYDEPFGDYSGYPTYKLSKIAKGSVDVSLSGDGGDEIFGGYNIHMNGYRMEFIRLFPRFVREILSFIPAKKNLNNSLNLYLLKEAFKLSLKDREEFFASSIDKDMFKPNVYKEWTVYKLRYALEKGGGNLAEGLRIFDLLFHTLPDNYLTKVDRASMGNTLEVRSPFLDYRIIEFSQKIPTKWKVDLFNTKKIMRDIIKLYLPKEIVYRGKQGFTPPLVDWILKDDYHPILEEGLKILSELNGDIYDFYRNKIFEDTSHRIYKVYIIRLYIFTLWYKRWISSV